MNGSQLTRRATWSALVSATMLSAALLALASCGSTTGDASPAESPGRPVVVATTSIWADVVSNVGCGGLVEVETLVPIGADPHGFEPSLADRGTLGGAALVVANGLLLEEGLAATIDAVEAEGVEVFRVAEHVDTIAFSADADAASANNGGEGAREGDDPHVWFDPTRVSAMLSALGEALIDSAGVDRSAIGACVEAYQARLAAADAEIIELVEGIPERDRTLVTSHDALGYFADRYGFEVIGTVIPVSSGLAETNPAQLQELADLIAEAGVPAIFAETQHSSDDAEALAARVEGVEVVTLRTGTLSETSGDSGTYVDFLLTNATLITEALG